MLTVYMVCAIVGGVLLLCQLIMTVAGLDGDHDIGGGDDFDAADHDVHAGDGDLHGSSWVFGALSFRSVTAALTFFGLSGLAANEAGLRPIFVLPISVVAGGTAMLAVAWMMRMLYGLKEEGNVRIENTVGQTARVYLTIPAHRKGAGKITVKVQNRTMEYQAVTKDEKLPTGTHVVVTNVLSPDSVEVEKAKD